MRINKLLSNYGYCSRKQVNSLIEQNRIYINGKLAIKGQWVTEEDDIKLDGHAAREKKRVYIAFNKPVGITCTCSNDKENNIIDFIGYDEYIFPVGRLDKDSEGLIILTNDGEFANRILNADNNHEKEYIVKVDRDFDEKFIQELSGGLEIDGVLTRKCIVHRLNSNTFNIVLTQGLNRQIRKMCKKCGYTVISLKRIRIMNIYLDGIDSGEYRSLTPLELETNINGNWKITK